MPRLAALLTVFLLAASASAALAQEPQPGSPLAPPFSPTTPAPEPAETPTPDPALEAAEEETDRTLLFVIGGGLIVLFVVIGRVITRDARQTLHERGQDEAAKPRDKGPHRHARQAKAKARAKTKAQRRARRQNR